jgi:hypothetical protein
MGLLGCYDGVMYCDEPTCSENFESFDFQTYGRFIAEARRRGWLYSPQKESINQGCGYCLCPKHSGKVKK